MDTEKIREIIQKIIDNKKSIIEIFEKIKNITKKIICLIKDFIKEKKRNLKRKNPNKNVC